VQIARKVNRETEFADKNLKAGADPLTPRTRTARNSVGRTRPDLWEGGAAFDPVLGRPDTAVSSLRVSRLGSRATTQAGKSGWMAQKVPKCAIWGALRGLNCIHVEAMRSFDM